MRLDDHDLFEPAIAEDPFAYYRALREQAPVHLMPSGMWIVSSHALCLDAMRDPGTFSSRFFQKMSGNVDPSARIAGPETLLSNDPPEHTYFRKLVNKAFSPNRVKKISASISDIAHDLFSRFEGKGRFEAVADLAVPLPLTVIADQLGVPRDHLAEFKRWSDASVVPLSGLASPEQVLESVALTTELQDYLAERAEERRADPRDDMLTDLVRAEVDGRPVEIREVVSILQQFLVAGNETTTNLIAAALQFLLQSPGELAKLRADRTLLPNAIEEAVRMETPVSGMWRVTTRDVDLGGTTIPGDSLVMLRYAAANRDPAVFEDPEQFRVDRENARDHLGFGMGVHYCPGASLAREEARIALDLVLDRLPGLRLAPGNDFTHHPSMLLRGLRRLDLEFDPS